MNIVKLIEHKKVITHTHTQEIRAYLLLGLLALSNSCSHCTHIPSQHWKNSSKVIAPAAKKLKSWQAI